MKQTIKSIFAMLLVLCMVFTIVGCGEKETSSDPVAAGNDFFKDEVTDNGTQGVTSDATASNVVASDNTSSNVSSNTSSAASSTDKNTSSNKTSSTYVSTPGGINISGGENIVGKTPGKPWKEVLASMPKKLRETSITVYNWNKPNEYTGAPAVIEAFTKQTGIKVNWITVNFDNYFSKITNVIASGKNIPDVVRARGPIPEYMLSYQPLSTANYDFTDKAWDESIMDLYSVNGVPYATTLQNTHIGCVNVLFYNKALIDKFNYEDPYQLWQDGKWTWKKYVEMCRDFKNEKENDNAPASCGEGHCWSYLGVHGIQGVIGFDGKKYYSKMEDAQVLKVHEKLSELYNDEKLFVLGQEPEFNKSLRLFSIGTSIHMRRKNSYFSKLKSEGTLYAVPMPAIDGQKKYYQGIAEAEAYAITNGAPNPEAVPYFLRYFLDGENYELSTYFCNKQNLDVYSWCMNQENKIFVYNYPKAIDQRVSGEGIIGQTKANIKGYIDSNKKTIEKVAKEYNDTIKKIKK